MYARQDLPPKLANLAASQAGILTTAQMIDGGLTRAVIRRLTAPWTRLMCGLYSTSPPTWHSAVWAGLLAGGKSAAAGGAAALYLHEVLRDPPSLVTVWSTEARMNLSLGPYSIMLRRGDRSSLGSLPRTKVEVSLLDMADHVDQDTLTDAVVRAFTSHKTTSTRLHEALKARGRNAHYVHLLQMCTRAVDGIESVLEWHFHSKVLEAHGIPLPVLQQRLLGSRSDGLWKDYGVRLELDGLRDHQDASRDWFKDNDHRISGGEVTLHYGWNASTRSACRAAAQSAVVLAREGWDGKPKQCGRRCDLQQFLEAYREAGLTQI